MSAQLKILLDLSALAWPITPPLLSRVPSLTQARMIVARAARARVQRSVAARPVRRGERGVRTSTMRKDSTWGAVLVLGAGRVGTAVTHLLSREPKYHIMVADRDPRKAQALAEQVPLQAAFVPVGIETEAQLNDLMKGMHAVVCCTNSPSGPVLRAAVRNHVHMVDVSEEPDTIEVARELNSHPGTRSSYIVHSGLSPGLTSIAARFIYDSFERCDKITCRAGALPEQPNNRLKYNLTWDASEIIAQYVSPCDMIRDYKRVNAAPMERLEGVMIDGVQYEAFTTSGGLGTLIESFEGKVKSLMFKTLRYPGHLELMRFLLNDLRFGEHKNELARVFERSVPSTNNDVAVLNVRGLGITHDGTLMERTFWRKIGPITVGKHRLSGLQVASGATACAALDWLLETGYSRGPWVRLEDIPLEKVLGSVFGKYLARGTGGPGQVV